MNALKTAISSRKFMLTLTGILFIVLNRALGLHVEEESITKIVGLIAAYVLGQGMVDAAEIHGSAKTKAELDAAAKDSNKPA